MFIKRVAEKTATLTSQHPRLFSIAMGFAITLAVGTAIGMSLDHYQAFAQGIHQDSNLQIYTTGHGAGN